MPLFFTPKPRQFHYEPRFYDPEKEKWEALKKKYAVEEPKEDAMEESSDEAAATDGEASIDEDLHYFEEKLRRIDREERRQGFGWKDLFRKREMPKFNYQPRFQNNESGNDGAEADASAMAKYGTDKNSRHIRIRRRYNMDDPEYMKPVSAGKIMIYVLLAWMLLYWILF